MVLVLTVMLMLVLLVVLMVLHWLMVIVLTVLVLLVWRALVFAWLSHFGALHPPPPTVVRAVSNCLCPWLCSEPCKTR